jgi:uncharacterized SAM-binding protein YcdF (DUF218 family)
MIRMRWVICGIALAGCWLFACEAWREQDPWFLVMLALGAGVPVAAAWHAIVRPDGLRSTLRGALWLVVALVVWDQLLDLAIPYPRRFGLAPWEALRAAAVVGGFALAAWRSRPAGLPRWWRVTARVLAAASLVLALLVPAAMVYLAFDGSGDHTEPTEAALVLGYALAPDGTAQPQLIGRMEHAIDLYKRGVVHHLVLSGGVGKAGRTEAGVMRDQALAAGVPAEALVLDEDARSTVENFACSRPLLERLGSGPVLVVTEPWHMSRAMLLARRHGIPAVASPASSEVWRRPRAAGYWLFRDAIAYLRERARDPFAEPGTCRARTCEGCRTF